MTVLKATISVEEIFLEVLASETLDENEDVYTDAIEVS